MSKTHEHGGVSESPENISVPVQEFIQAKLLEMSHTNTPTGSSPNNKLQSGEKSQPYNPSTATFSSVKGSGLVLFTLAILAFTLYLSYYLWRKHRCRNMVALSKGCQYSRLNQMETDDVDSVVFSSEPLLEEQNGHLESSWVEADNCKPATLEVVTDSLITISNYSSSNPPNGTLHTDNSIVSVGSDLSDEDLLQ